MTRGLEMHGTAGLSPPAELRELRELGERLGRKIAVTAQFMICRMQPVLTRGLDVDYGE